MNGRPNIYQTLKNFLNHESVGDNIHVAAMCDATDGVEVVTGWKRMNNNPKYTTRMYVCHLMKTGFLTRVSRGVYRLNALIPDWCDLGVLWYANGYPQYDWRTKTYVLYHGKDASQWKQAIKDYLNGTQVSATAAQPTEQPNAASSGAVHPHSDEMVAAEFSKKSKLTDADWIKLTKLFVSYCHQGQRAGQAYMNALYCVNKSLSDDISESDADCFYDDDKLVAFIQYLNCGKLMKPQAKLGNHVVTKKNCFRGVVYQVHHDFHHTGENLDWFNSQRPIDTELLSKPWVSILCDGAGSILVPISDIAEITSLTPSDNGNPWFSFYFNV